MPGPKILLLDIETAPHRVYAWGLWGQDIHLDQIEEPGFTLCWAAKWFGEKRIHFASIQRGGRKGMVQRIWMLLDQADIVVHYNGTKFDIPVLNQEFMGLGMKPPSPYKQVDLLRYVRKNFRMASNKLDYVAGRLKLGQKVRHKGMLLWKGCMEGRQADWKEMKEYNIRDVDLLERLYVELLPWIDTHPNVGLWLRHSADRPACTNCGSSRVVAQGTHRAKTRTYQRWSCKDCGSWMRSTKTDKGSTVKVTN